MEIPILSSYISWFLAAHNEKSGVCNVIQGGILKSALLCKDYLAAKIGMCRSPISPHSPINFDVAMANYFLFFLLNPASPTIPVPRSRIVHGSGTTLTLATVTSGMKLPLAMCP